MKTIQRSVKHKQFTQDLEKNSKRPNQMFSYNFQRRFFCTAYGFARTLHPLSLYPQSSGPEAHSVIWIPSPCFPWTSQEET